MSDFYLLQAPFAGPEQPDCWSWSSLLAWRTCPRKWWLLRAHYPNASTPYPQPAYPAAIEGLLVHHALEAFADHAERAVANGITQAPEIRSSFPARKVIQQKLRDITSSGGNPRLAVRRLLPRVSVDDCVNAFRRVATSCLASVLNTRSGRSHDAPRRGVQMGAEVSIRVADPPLCGRLDYITPNGIIDFKTGDADPTHHEQMRFYAMLMWLLTGRAPDTLTLLYLRDDRPVPVAVPSLAELGEMVHAYRSEIAANSARITGDPPDAWPNESNCRGCPVRQLCDSYWVSAETAALRLTTSTLQGLPDGQRAWVDVELTSLPSVNQLGGYSGVGIARDIGETRISIAPSQVAAVSGSIACGARILNAMVEKRDGLLHLTAAVSSEVFWIPAAGG